MTYYGAKEIATSFRTVRNNTIRIAEEIPEDKYGFRPTEEMRTIAQMLTHVSNNHRFHFAERNISRQVFEAAIRGDDDALRADIGQRSLDPRRDHLRRFDFHR